MLFLSILGGSAGLLVGASAYFHHVGGAQRIAAMRESELHAVSMRQDAVSAVLQVAVGDLLFLADLNEIGAFLESHAPENRAPLEQELAAFSRRRAMYSQIRLLSPPGMELLRIDFDPSAPVVVPVEELQYKGDRYYYSALAECSASSVYISPLDLNVENEEVERPLSPMLRLAVALGNGSDVRGYLILNVAGEVLLDAFANAHPSHNAFALLADEEGHWLRGITPDGEWGSDLPERQNHRFQNTFPEEWDVVSASAMGQLVTGDGLFTFDTIVPYAEADSIRCSIVGGYPSELAQASYWKNVSWVPAEVMFSTRNAGAGLLVGWNIVGVLLLGTGSWIFSRWVSRRSELHDRTTREKNLLQTTLGRYMPVQVRERMLRDPARHARLGGEARYISVLFADIRGFTRFAEQRAPEEVVAVLNRTMAVLTEPLRLYGGILDKYIGDGFLAFFEPDNGSGDAAKRAVDAARAMQSAFHSLWAEAPTAALRELGLGIGISAGRVIVGNIGSEEAMDYTVVGDAVNVAARLQDLALAGEILVAAPAFDSLQEHPDAEIMPRTKLRGRRKPIDVYRLITSTDDSR